MNLNLRQMPIQVDYSGFVILPGLSEELREVLAEIESEEQNDEEEE